MIVKGHIDPMFARHSIAVTILATVATSFIQDGARLIANEPPNAELPYEFTQVYQVYELRDGRVVTLDRAEAELRLANFSTGGSAVLGRKGQGPREYLTPLDLIPLGGDSVGAYDDAGIRVLVIRSDGQLGGFVQATPNAESHFGAKFGDGRGWLYGEGRPTDSASLHRWRLGDGRLETIAKIARPVPEGAISDHPGTIRPGSFARPSTRNIWAVSNDGRIGIVNFEPYHVEIVMMGGERRRGREIPYARSALNDSIKQAFLNERVPVSTGVMIDANGKATTFRQPSRARSASSITWAARVPAFRDNAFVAFASDGKLWIQRTTFGREGGRYDIIGRDGSLVDRVRFPEGHRVVGFGKDVMYVVRRDADDLEFLQRRPLPR